MLAWVSFQWLPEHVSPDAQAALFLAWTVPLAVFLAQRLLAAALATQAASSSPIAATERPSALRDPTAAAEPQEMTVSALPRPLSVS